MPCAANSTASSLATVVACGKELLRRGFDIIPADYDHDEYEDSDDVQHCHDEPFDHKKYAREQFWRDGADGKALAKIYGSEEAVSVALSAVRTHRRKTVLADAHIPDRDYTPFENPEDDPYGKGCYGYDTLRLSFNDNQTIRVANKAVAEYKQKAQHPPVGAGFKPARGLARPSTGRESETGQPSEDPDHHSPVPPEQPQNPPVGAGFKPARGLARPSTGRESKPPENPDPGQSKSHKLSDAKDPPRKRPVKIFTGPPDEEPRETRDTGDI